MDIFFPYEKIRDSQDKLISLIQQALKDKTNLIVHAPTGLGKTSAVFSTTIPFAMKNKLNIFFLTPRHTQHLLAVETIKEINKKFSLKLKAVDVIGKKSFCLQHGIQDLNSNDFSEYCKHLVDKGNCIYHSNLRHKNKITLEASKLLNQLKNEILHAEEVKSLCKDICPHEITMLLAKNSKIIVADYNHILNPVIRENLIKKTDKELSNSIIILDEAHNLPQKAREILSVFLSTYTLDQSISEAKYFNHEENRDILENMKQILLNYAKNMPINVDEILLKKQDFKIDNEAVELLRLTEESSYEEKKYSFTTPIINFLLAWQGQDSGFTRILKKGFTQKGKPFVSLFYKCLDPSLLIKPLADSSYSTICMSGTLSPVEMYKKLFNINSITSELTSPFPKQNKLSIIIPETTTKFTTRSSEMYKKIADICTKIINSIPGNSLVFFPSYNIRDEVYSYLSNITKTILLEHQNISKDEKKQLLEKFKKCKSTGATLLAVSTGNFGEGIDLIGDLLKAVIVIGLPLAKPTLETKELINYYDIKFGRGWEYGYTFPALTKCFQNAGRCIRSETDKGVIIYIDERLIQGNYFKFFPKQQELKITKDFLTEINNFFKE